MVLIKAPNRRIYEQLLGATSRGLAIRRCWVIYIVAVCLYAAGRSQNRPGGLRGSDQELLSSDSDAVTASTADEGLDNTAGTDENKSAVEEVVPAPAPEPDPPVPAASLHGTSGSKICERDIPINLADTTSWPTPYTPSYFDKEPIDSKDAVLMSAGIPFGDTLIIGIFHALDFAYDQRCPVYVTKDCDWIWDKLTPWFFGENYVRNNDFWKAVIVSFGVQILDDSKPETVDAIGKTWHKITSDAGYRARSNELDAVQLRNRRDTIFRMLFQQSRTEGEGNVCANLISSEMNKPGAKYTVIDVPYAAPWNDRVKEFTGRDHSAAFEMKPEYVKSILEPLDMLQHAIFLQKSWSNSDPDREEIQLLIQDSALKTQEKDITNDLHMAVLSDVFIGSPGSHYSLMVARMRYALGIKNSFVLTEKKDDNWMSYIDDTNYLELYANNPWLG